MTIFSNKFAGGSSVFHAVKGLLFTRKGLAFKIRYLKSDSNNRNLSILNEERLKKRLFSFIQSYYNRRINEKKLKLPLLTNDRLSDFKISKYHLIKNSIDDEDIEDFSGYFDIFPTWFVCKKCGHIKKLDRKKTFNPTKCQNPIKNCDGSYEQISVALFCEKCGRVDQLHWSCKGHPVFLKRGSKDSLKTWRVTCGEPSCKNYNNLRDIFSFHCSHQDPMIHSMTSPKLLSGSAKQIPMTITEGSVFLPVTDSCIDIPNCQGIDLEDLEYVLLGMYLKIFPSKLNDPNLTLKELTSKISYYYDENLKNQMFKMSDYDSLSDEEKQKKWIKVWKIDIINQEIEKLKDIFQDTLLLQDINNYAALIGEIPGNDVNFLKYSEFIEGLELKSRNTKNNQWKIIKDEYNIIEITFIPKINLLLSCYGLFNGPYKFWEGDSFVPHFEPIWSKSNEREKFTSYTYPYETEGIVFSVDKIKICNWLYSQFLIDQPINSVDEASKKLLTLNKDSDAYDKIFCLLHTYSHLLIGQASIFTGLDTNSCSEMIFPRTAAFFIYSTSNINIGGFQYVFEHELIKWFNQIKYAVYECTLDPSCIEEGGACFSCLYLPEFVCSTFNKNLDRDIFIGSKRYSKGFWM